MKLILKPTRVLLVCWLAGQISVSLAAAQATPEPWVEAMRKVHARFTGERGTLAHFGDSITVTMAFWSPLAWAQKNMPPEMSQAHTRVKAYMKPDCWSKWKGSEYGNEGSMTIRWAHQNVATWIKKLNPEVVVIMFGSNDVGQMEVAEYEEKTRQVVQHCLGNGTVVVLTTMPPRSGRLEKSRVFAEAAQKIAREEKIPLIDYFGAIMKRRPEDWAGSLAKFKTVPGDTYDVPTLICRDGVHPSNPKAYSGDYSEEALRNSGYGLRNYVTLLAYAAVIEKVLQPAQ